MCHLLVYDSLLEKEFSGTISEATHVIMPQAVEKRQEDVRHRRSVWSLVVDASFEYVVSSP